MFPEIDRFHKWLRCRNPYTSTHVHYTGDVRLFFAWAGKSPASITLHDVDAYVAHCRGLGHAPATVNRRLAALRAFYRFLSIDSHDPPPNSVLHRCHTIRKGQTPTSMNWCTIPACMGSRAVLQYLHISWRGVVG